VRFVPTALPEVIEVQPVRRGDDRGWFSEVFKVDAFAEAGLDVEFIQDNESLSAASGTLRGIHYQIAPNAQAKLVRVIRGSIFDVAVDLRRSSPTFGQHVAVTLSAESGNQLFVPIGFGHGFRTLEADTQVGYKVSGRYSTECERAIRWDDPQLAIAWPADLTEPTMSDKDAHAPLLADQPDLFE